MTTPATELQKLLELRDAGELTEAEFAAAKSRILRPELHQPPRRSWGLFDSFGSGLLTILIATGVLVGGTTLIALTEAGAIALVALALVALAMIVVWFVRDTF
jgi:hypothetical protein